MSDRGQAGLGRHSQGNEYQNIHVGGEAKVIIGNTYKNSKIPKHHFVSESSQHGYKWYQL